MKKILDMKKMSVLALGLIAFAQRDFTTTNRSHINDI
jgi:hypothetical protein